MADDFRPMDGDRIVSKEMAPDVPRYSRGGRRIMGAQREITNPTGARD